MKKRRQSSLIAVLTVLMGGFIVSTCSSCSWFAGDITDQEVTEMQQDMKAESRVTVFTQSLNQLGRMLNAYYIPKTPVQSKNIGNQTGEKNLPSELYTMIAAAINKIGRPLIFVPYDAQYVISESSTGGTIFRLYPKIVLAGGITGYDKDMFAKERETEASGGWAGAQGGGRLNASGNYSRITFDLNALDYKTQSYLPQVLASNSIALTKNRLGWGVFAYYMGNGASFDYNLKRKQGIHAALRNLVEFSIIEVLGKCFKVPYWRTIKGAKPDNNMIARISNEFSEMNKAQQALIIKKFLFLHGYNGINRQDYVFKDQENEALKSAMRQYQAKNLHELYIKLWLNVPILKAIRRVSIDRRRMANLARKRQHQQQLMVAQRKAKAQLIMQAKLRQHKLKVSKYNSFIARGDRLFKVRNYSKALIAYSNAHQLFGGEAYPKTMINKIKYELNRQQAAINRYNKALKLADQLYAAAAKESFNFKQYKQALQAYRKTLALSPNNRYIEEQIKKIKHQMSKYTNVLQDQGAW